MVGPALKLQQLPFKSPASSSPSDIADYRIGYLLHFSSIVPRWLNTEKSIMDVKLKYMFG